MAKLQLSKGGFKLLDEGDITLRFDEVEYDEDEGVLTITFMTDRGSEHVETYNLVDFDGEVNEGANNAWSFLAKKAMNNMDLEEIDTDELIGCYVSATVVHKESKTINKTTGKPYINSNFTELESASGFPKGKKASAKKPAVSETVEDDDDFWAD